MPVISKIVEKELNNILDRYDIQKGKNYYDGYINYLDYEEENGMTNYYFNVESERTYDVYEVVISVCGGHIVKHKCECPQHKAFNSCKHVAACIINYSDEIYEITTEPSDFTQVSEKLEEAGLEFIDAGVQMVPTTTVQLDEKGVEKMERLIERLEELDDVANIYHNWEE